GLSVPLVVAGFSAVSASRQRPGSQWGGVDAEDGGPAMPRIFISRVVTGAVFSAVLAGGSLSLAATTASATCWNATCRGAPPPAAGPSLLQCSDPTCLSGTRPAAAPRPVARPAINCPPPNPKVLASDVSDC